MLMSRLVSDQALWRRPPRLAPHLALLVFDAVLHGDVGHHPCETISWLSVVLSERPARHLDDFGFALDGQRFHQRGSIFGFVILRSPLGLITQDRCPENPL